jgi:hypothetical protein
MSRNPSHAQKLNTKFEKEEKARRARAGKMTEAPAKQSSEQANFTPECFTLPAGERL